MAGLMDIFNGALSRLGIRACTGEEDQRQEVLFCRANVQQAMDQVLEAGEFSFSLCREGLTELAEEVPGFAHVYNLPSGMLHLVRVYPGESDWSIIGKELCSNGVCDWVEYVKRVKAEEFSPWSAECVSILLASKLAVLCTNQAGLTGELLREYVQTALPAARREDNAQKQVYRGRKYWA